MHNKLHAKVQVEPISTALLAPQVRSRLQFLTWARETFPDLYSAAMSAAENNTLSGLGVHGEEVTSESWWRKAAGAFTALGTTYLGLKNQRDIMQINLERAKTGQPPISGEDLTAPIVQTRIDLPPETIDRLTAGAGAQVNKMLMFGAIALVGVLIFMRR